MKYLIVSDIHGSSESAKIIIDYFNKYNCDMILCLGDILYHGPRNDLPLFYEPKKVIQVFNEYADRILCVQGNCDAEVDQMVLNFKIHKSLDLKLNGFSFHLEHGHHLDDLHTEAKYVLFGHTHISQIESKSNKIFINPGSITIPKNNTKRGFMILDSDNLIHYDIDGNILTSLKCH